MTASSNVIAISSLKLSRLAGHKFCYNSRYSLDNDSALADFHTALGQFLNYRLVLEEIEPERILYLAVPNSAYQSFFQRELPKASVKRHQVKIIVYDPVKEEICKWIN
ncbi:MAG TPA: hypothetical protein DEG17_24720 [Cyanobacteria bacterium UBA11149]|nr:hypothetical protein [Cyanobacteria bacterium UBA11367]HBE59614.1 hypothetical protein [Cyanobacteria bacterium UBA11366]HBK65132.1 hypothetical protein [Cyanobacteria bacterium UBA11166]HBR75453.1 hypothetical protein [Cyanobacteria bacterium UBA11159]HBS70005.1 hypothetical protein [Cyanobacteria bacterium UBA11153]HBW91982.1 hypothetical protein [Cyanobacteria bacterium UBA11149]HCA94114.1 hypothetical protein [Cyanobacteria bacterium UBA9226]